MSRGTPRVERMWAITGRFNKRGVFYEGTALTRRGAIESHAYAKGKPWSVCYRIGDRAVRVFVVLDLPGWTLRFERRRTT